MRVWAGSICHECENGIYFWFNVWFLGEEESNPVDADKNTLVVESNNVERDVDNSACISALFGDTLDELSAEDVLAVLQDRMSVNWTIFCIVELLWSVVKILL